MSLRNRCKLNTKKKPFPGYSERFRGWNVEYCCFENCNKEPTMEVEFEGLSYGLEGEEIPVSYSEMYCSDHFIDLLEYNESGDTISAQKVKEIGTIKEGYKEYFYYKNFIFKNLIIKKMEKKEFKNYKKITEFLKKRSKNELDLQGL